ncbi:hypothetical protein HDU87_005538 [Geranomyces variabilis]|uniref:Uncharacterized protein n=1 Tax=Geranomyces variabilis TaxID=109894 RepID=A0AAD5TIC6_9FUNG|nr:hypothetical protein HDU87_005538 [Geranomyces variabilis]
MQTMLARHSKQQQSTFLAALALLLGLLLWAPGITAFSTDVNLSGENQLPPPFFFTVSYDPDDLASVSIDGEDVGCSFQPRKASTAAWAAVAVPAPNYNASSPSISCVFSDTTERPAQIGILTFFSLTTNESVFTDTIWAGTPVKESRSCHFNSATAFQGKDDGADLSLFSPNSDKNTFCATTAAVRNTTAANAWKAINGQLGSLLPDLREFAVGDKVPELKVQALLLGLPVRMLQGTDSMSFYSADVNKLATDSTAWSMQQACSGNGTCLNAQPLFSLLYPYFNASVTTNGNVTTSLFDSASNKITLFSDLAGAYAMSATGTAYVFIDASVNRIVRGTHLAKTIEALLLYNRNVTGVDFIVEQNSTTTCPTFQASLEKFVQQSASVSCGQGRDAVTPYALVAWNPTGYEECQPSTLERRFGPFGGPNPKKRKRSTVTTVTRASVELEALSNAISVVQDSFNNRAATNFKTPGLAVPDQLILENIDEDPFTVVRAVDPQDLNFYRQPSQCAAGQSLSFTLNLDTSHPLALEIRTKISRTGSRTGIIYAVTSPLLMQLPDWFLYTNTDDVNRWAVAFSVTSGNNQPTTYVVTITLKTWGIYGETTIWFTTSPVWSAFSNVALDVTFICGRTSSLLDQRSPPPLPGVQEELSPIEDLMQSYPPNPPPGRGPIMAWNVQGFSESPLAGKPELLIWTAQQSFVTLFNEGGKSLQKALSASDLLNVSPSCLKNVVTVRKDQGLVVNDGVVNDGCYELNTHLAGTCLYRHVKAPSRSPVAFRQVMCAVTPKAVITRLTDGECRVDKTVMSESGEQVIQNFAVIPLHWKSATTALQADARALVLYAEYLRVTYGVAVVAGGDFNTESLQTVLQDLTITETGAHNHNLAALFTRYLRSVAVPASPTHMKNSNSKNYDSLWFMHGAASKVPQSVRVEKTDVNVYADPESIFYKMDPDADSNGNDLCRKTAQQSCSVEFSNHHPVVFNVMIGTTQFSIMSWNVDNLPLLSKAPIPPNTITPDNSFNTDPQLVGHVRNTRFQKYIDQFDIRAFQELPEGREIVADSRRNGISIPTTGSSPLKQAACKSLIYTLRPAELRTESAGKEGQMRACMFGEAGLTIIPFIVISVHAYSTEPPLLSTDLNRAPTIDDVLNFQAQLAEFCVSSLKAPPFSVTEVDARKRCAFQVPADRTRIPLIVVGDFNSDWLTGYTGDGNRRAGPWTEYDLTAFRQSYNSDRQKYAKTISTNLGLSCQLADTTAAGEDNMLAKLILPGVDDEILAEAVTDGVHSVPNQACGILGSRRMPWATTLKGSYFDMAYVCDPASVVTFRRAKIDPFLRGFVFDGEANPVCEKPTEKLFGTDGCTEGYGAWPGSSNGQSCLLDDTSDHRPVYARAAAAS